jgi:hypothetical protein
MNDLPHPCRIFTYKDSSLLPANFAARVLPHNHDLLRQNGATLALASCSLVAQVITNLVKTGRTAPDFSVLNDIIMFDSAPIRVGTVCAYGSITDVQSHAVHII